MIHEVEWNAERVERFWNWYGSNPALEENYFAKAVGRDLIRYVSKRATIGAALDMGCGRGDLTSFLIESHPTFCTDQSPDSVQTVTERFKGQPNFKGAVVGTSTLPDGGFDTVFLLEVVEHLDDETLAIVLKDARRLLKVGGTLVVTTPNDENLTASHIMCPECECVFHRVQHVRKWTAGTLAPYINALGFNGRAEPARLSREGMRRRLQTAVYRQLGYKPHLIYMGVKK